MKLPTHFDLSNNKLLMFCLVVLGHLIMHLVRAKHKVVGNSSTVNKQGLNEKRVTPQRLSFLEKEEGGLNDNFTVHKKQILKLNKSGINMYI